MTAPLLEHPSHSHRVFFADSIGCLRVTYSPSQQLPEKYAGPSVHTVILPGFRSHSDQAVQRMAEGTLGEDTWVVAMARKNGSIHVVQIEDSGAESSSATGPGVKANVLCTIKEERMKAGIQRWVGLAISKEGVYSCTSAGAWRFTPVNLDDAELVAEPSTLELPGPLQHLCFYPASNPTHFSYGGEEIPVSLWDISVALSEQPQSMVGDESVESITTDTGMNAKLRKRKRQAEARAKAKEHQWGEIWKAKNLPNDALSLPQRANITQVAIVAMSPKTSQDIPTDTIIVGTRDGLIRVFEPAKGKKHTREHRIIHAGEGSIKTMGTGLSKGELFVADTAGRLCSVDWRNGTIQYSYEDITGAITSFCPLEAPRGAPLLISTSQDKLVRLHTTVPPSNKAEAKSKQRGETLWTTFASSSNTAPATVMTACVWDGKVPTLLAEEEKTTDVDSEEEGSEASQDEIWSKMAEIGAPKNTVDQDEEEDEETQKEERAKRTRK